MDAQRIGKCLTKLQDFYKTPLSPDLQEEFISFCIDNFQGIAQVEKATSLLIQNEPNYGRMPAFKRMKDLFSEYMQPQQRPEYQVVDASTFALPPAADRGVSPKDWTPLTSEEIATARWGTKHPVIERLKAKIHVSQFFKSQAALPHGQRYREEAIAEANARGIPLDLIGVVQKVAA